TADNAVSRRTHIAAAGADGHIGSGVGNHVPLSTANEGPVTGVDVSATAHHYSVEMLGAIENPAADERAAAPVRVGSSSHNDGIGSIRFNCVCEAAANE